MFVLIQSLSHSSLSSLQESRTLAPEYCNTDVHAKNSMLVPHAMVVMMITRPCLDHAVGQTDQGTVGRDSACTFTKGAHPLMLYQPKSLRHGSFAM